MTFCIEFSKSFLNPAATLNRKIDQVNPKLWHCARSWVGQKQIVPSKCKKYFVQKWTWLVKPQKVMPSEFEKYFMKT